MYLREFTAAIKAVSEVLDYEYHSITCSYVNDSFIFEPANQPDDKRIVYFAQTGRIEIHYPDTWRHPEHIAILKEGSEA